MTGAVRAAYVILAHENWHQVERLSRAILGSSPSSRVLIAHDARASAFPAYADDERVTVYAHGLRSDWGSWHIVEASLDAFARARLLWSPDIVTLISGSDYPIRRLDAWEREAVQSGGWIGEAAPLDYHPRWGRRRGRGDDRFTRYAYRWYRVPWSGPMQRAPRLLRKVQGGIALRAEPVFGVRLLTRGRGLHYGFRRCRAGAQYWIGSQWVAVCRPQLDELLDVDFRPHSPLRRLYRRTVIPDESAIVTALASRCPPNPMPPISYTDWNGATTSPRVLDIEDLPSLLDSGSPFARKFDARSGELMAALDTITSAPHAG